MYIVSCSYLVCIINQNKITMTNTLKLITNSIDHRGGTSFVVGGSVRDEFFGTPSKDIDVEVFGLDIDTLINVLSVFGDVNVVGKSFGVIKLTTPDGDDFDFSLPRWDSNTGNGHRDVVVKVDHNMTPEEACVRRDFTMNAMSRNLLTGELIDPVGGQNDINDKVLRHTSDQFGEDPLRVLRGMQFCGRFELTAHVDTTFECARIFDKFDALPKERVWGEWEKLLMKSTKPSMGLKFLKDTRWITHFPELEDLIDCPQNPKWHPEGDVFTHTGHVLDSAVNISNNIGMTPDERCIVRLGALCHDFGKPSTTILPKCSAPGHDKAGEAPTLSFLKRIGAPKKFWKPVVTLVKEHMVHVGLENSTPSQRMVNRLLNRLNDGGVDLTLLGIVVEADHSGRPPLPKRMPADFMKIVNASAELPPKIKPLVMGRHLLDLGVVPGKEMGDILRTLFELQLDGHFDTVDGGLELLKRHEIL